MFLIPKLIPIYWNRDSFGDKPSATQHFPLFFLLIYDHVKLQRNLEAFLIVLTCLVSQKYAPKNETLTSNALVKAHSVQY